MYPNEFPEQFYNEANTGPNIVVITTEGIQKGYYDFQFDKLPKEYVESLAYVPYDDEYDGPFKRYIEIEKPSN